ncbi:MAG: hypothetical protein LBS30_06170 [Planctomycetota bacterium]|jgi:hypothetical protein|nr:hypothetical protein [Planctomycetota bacterium]
MDDAAMNHILEATGFPDREAHGLDGAETAVRAERHFPRERFIRCLTLCAVIAAVGFMAWRPAMLRLSQLLFLVSPSHGDTLAWRPETEEASIPVPIRKPGLEPAEWRLDSGARGSWRAGRRAADEHPSWRGSDILPVRWRRLSGNPWNWRDDAALHLRRGEHAQPPQKAASSFRVKQEDAWVAGVAAASPAALEAVDAVETEKRDKEPGLLPPLTIPSIALSSDSSGLSELPPLSLDAIATGNPDIPTLPVLPAETADWKSREITGPIPGAYLTIYPKLKFVGLCVPGQGYIRKYNQVGVPRDPAGDKMAAADGRTPYGKYYIAARRAGEQGPRMELSWPSPEDAIRVGLGAPETAAIEAAWRDQNLPPQDTTAGGGVALTGLRDLPENTDGGFALETPHMEEIATALPDGAWVFIQE